MDHKNIKPSSDDISRRELNAIQRRIETHIAEHGVPSDEELHDEIEAMNQSSASSIGKQIEIESDSNNKSNPAKDFEKWKSQFISAAKADGFNEFRRHLEYLGMNYPPEAMLQGTLMLMPAVMAYQQLDGLSAEEMLRRQKYWLTGEGLPHFCLTFDLCGLTVGRVLTDEKFSGVDFSDLYGHPWNELERVGFYQVWISRLDGHPISKEELGSMDHLIRNDLFYDYDEDELDVDLSFMDLNDSVLLSVNDHDEAWDFSK